MIEASPNLPEVLNRVSPAYSFLIAVRLFELIRKLKATNDCSILRSIQTSLALNILDLGASVSTGGSAICARSVEDHAYVSTGGSAICARSVEGQAFVSTGGSAICARTVEAARILGLPARARAQ